MMNKEEKIDVAVRFYEDQGYDLVERERMGWDLILNKVDETEEWWGKEASLTYVIVANGDNADPMISKEYHPSRCEINGVSTFIEVNYIIIDELSDTVVVDQYKVDQVCKIIGREWYDKEVL